MKKILLTGASGFLGRRLLLSLINSYSVVSAIRRADASFRGTQVVVDNIDLKTEWGPALSGVGTVIHAAARVHVMHDVSVDPLEKFREVNVYGSLNLARQAQAM